MVSQLEQTGSTIFQTLAGLVLDVKSKKPESSASPNGDDRDMQFLLNAFITMNVLQFIAIATVAYYDHKRKEAAAKNADALLASPIEEESDSDDSDAGRAKEPIEIPVPVPAIGERSGTIRSIRSVRSVRLASVSAQETVPLLRSTSQASSRRSSRYLIPGVPPSSSVPLKFSKGELRRGKIFAVLSGCMIIFAWVLFMGTAWYRLRSKEDRGHLIR